MRNVGNNAAAQNVGGTVEMIAVDEENKDLESSIDRLKRGLRISKIMCIVLGVVSFQLSISGRDIEGVRSGLEGLFDGLAYGKVEKNGGVISYTVNTPNVQADMLFYGGSGVVLPEGWKIGYDADADIIATVHMGGTYYAPEALLQD